MPLDVERIEQLRKERGWSQDEAATRAGMKSRQVWNNFVHERNVLTVPQFEAVAAAFGVAPGTLLKSSPAPKPGPRPRREKP